MKSLVSAMSIVRLILRPDYQMGKELRYSKWYSVGIRIIYKRWTSKYCKIKTMMRLCLGKHMWLIGSRSMLLKTICLLVLLLYNRITEPLFRTISHRGWRRRLRTAVKNSLNHLLLDMLISAKTQEFISKLYQLKRSSWRSNNNVSQSVSRRRQTKT